MRTDNINEILYLFADKYHLKEELHTPFTQGDNVFATNAIFLIRVAKGLCPVEYPHSDKPKNVLSIIGESNVSIMTRNEDIEKALESAEMIDEVTETGQNVKCHECDGEGSVTWEYGRWEMDGDCPVCDGSGYSSSTKETPTGRKIPNPISPVKLNGILFRHQYLSLLLKTMSLLGVDEIEMARKEKGNTNVFKASEDIDILIMSLME